MRAHLKQCISTSSLTNSCQWLKTLKNDIMIKVKFGCLDCAWILLFLLSQLFEPLLGRTTSRCRCWAAIRLSHRPEPTGHAVHGKVDRLDIGGQHGLRSVPLRHSHKTQKGPYPICTSRRGNVRHRCGGG